MARYVVYLTTPELEIHRFGSKKLRRFVNRIRREPWLRAYLVVTYENGEKNEGEYTTEHDLLEALTAFTEPELFDYVKESIGELE